MSTIQSSNPGQTTSGQSQTCACTISWSIARQAVVAAQPELGFNTTSGKPIELRIRIESETKAHAELADPSSERTHRLELGSPRLTFVDAEPYTHIELMDAERLILACTTKRQDDGDSLLYARTGLITELNIVGGRYSAPKLL